MADKMLAAEAIVFGAPTYYGTINSLAHACLERTFCFRHCEVFGLAGKLGVAVGVGGRGPDEPSPAIETIRRMMNAKLMAVVGEVRVDGYAQCYTCGFGHDRAVGGVVGRHGFLECIEEEHLPPRLAQQEDASFRAYKVGKTLGSILRTRGA
jgi:multimeric flavodoxin WrbA